MSESNAVLGTWDLGADEAEAPVKASKSSRVTKPKKAKKASGTTGELAQAMLGQLGKDKKMWVALAEETFEHPSPDVSFRAPS